MNTADNQNCELLVYIPCHQDFELAVRQAQKLKSVHFKKFIDIKVLISINGVSLTKCEKQRLESACDQLIIHSEAIGADLNIAYGFIRAAQISSDLFWILSSIDALVETEIENLLFRILKLRESDVVLLGSSDSELFLTDGRSVFEYPNLHFGLISAVIYRTESFKSAFSEAQNYSWTCWTQLAVLQKCLFEKKKLHISIIDSKKYYQIDHREIINSQNEIKRIELTYYKSFYGLPILFSEFFIPNRRYLRKLILIWLLRSNFSISFFNNIADSPIKANNNKIKSLSESIIMKSGIANGIIYRLFRLPLWRYLYLLKLEKFSWLS